MNCLFNEDKIILDLCGGTGAWSKPYKDNGYDVRNITLPEYDVRTYISPNNVYGILAAPPCTHLAISGARWWKKKGDEALFEALAIVDACMRIILIRQPEFWCLENPVGRLSKYLGKPKLIFQPYEFGDPWTKRTCLWGKFNIPMKKPVKPIGQYMGRKNSPGLVDHFGEYLPPDWIHKFPQGKERSILRGITPPNFALAFFEANP